MQFTYEQYYNEMNRVYYSVHNWPQPYNYKQWYNSLTQQQQNAAVHPNYYVQIYVYAIESARAQNYQNKPVKPSRNQKRKMKKKLLQEELAKQQQAIGNWVKLQRKDLIEGIEKINKKEAKIKQKKEDKLSHLIAINKEVAKIYRKHHSAQEPIKRRVATDKSKKRISYIKKLKQTFENNKKRYIGLQQKEDEWQSDNEQELYIKQSQQKAQKVVSPLKKEELKEIEYSNLSKLTGIRYHNIVLRQWVRNCPSETLDDLVLKLVNRLAYKQAIRRVQKPDKAKKLVVSGLKECKRTLTTIIDKKKAKILIVGLNIERNPYKGGVDDQVQAIIQLAQTQKILIVHACIRSHLGRAFTGKWGPRLTMISIINYEGYQDMVEAMLDEWQIACKKYNDLS